MLHIFDIARIQRHQDDNALLRIRSTPLARGDFYLMLFLAVAHEN